MSLFTLKTIRAAALVLLLPLVAWAQNPEAIKKVYIPDFSYAGYRFSESQPDTTGWSRIDVAKHGILANDEIDDTTALKQLLETLNQQDEPVLLQFGKGRYEFSDIIHINRSNLVLRGAGTGRGGTEFYIPRPLLYVEQPGEVNELTKYLVELNKIQKEKDRNIELPFSPWSWTGGFFWTGIRDQRVKGYLERYDREVAPLALLQQGTKDEFSFRVDDPGKLQSGQVVQINWFNPEGEQGSLLRQLYGESDVTIGSHHWNFPRLPLSRQQAKITSVAGDIVTIASPLLHDVSTNWNVELMEWPHISNVGLEHFKITFPAHPRVAHHLEPGYNGIYLTRVFDSWVRDVVIENADSGILTESASNVTIERVTTRGTSMAHYSVQLGGVHNILVKDLRVENPVEHPLSFNTFANKSVYLNSYVRQNPVLDQHSGANHQNLFDNTRVEVELPADSMDTGYPLFKGGGAGYWKPSHGNYSTFWNTQVQFTNGALNQAPILLNGMKDGPNARVVGVSANLPIRVEYGPDAYIEGVGQYYANMPSLFLHQLQQRMHTGKTDHQ